jgi:hypothetical protein
MNRSRIFCASASLAALMCVAGCERSNVPPPERKPDNVQERKVPRDQGVERPAPTDGRQGGPMK